MALPEIEVFDTSAELAQAVAGELLNRIADAQASGRVPHVVLTGGRIARDIHRAVEAGSDASGVDWGAVELWWSDDRFLPATDDERNARQARQDFIDAVMVPTHRIHEIGSSSAFSDVHEAAHAYAHEVEDHGPDRFDVVMLSVGPDGHIASLFPGSPQLGVSDHAATEVEDAPKPPAQRISLTLRTLLGSTAVWLFAVGAEKADIVKAINDGADLPATAMAAHPQATVFLDRDAAALL